MSLLMEGSDALGTAIILSNIPSSFLDSSSFQKVITHWPQRQTSCYVCYACYALCLLPIKVYINALQSTHIGKLVSLTDVHRDREGNY